LILKIYNYFQTFWEKPDTEALLNKIEIIDIIDNDSSILGETNNYQEIYLTKQVFNCNFKTYLWQMWKTGYFSTFNFFHVLVHELGHLFYFYDFNTLQINYSDCLKEFLINKVTDFKKLNISKELLLKIFANSSYGLTDDEELIAEGFAYWILTTDEKFKTLSWDFWNEFFTSYLLQVRTTQ
jgi:hypothetical protein